MNNRLSISLCSLPLLIAAAYGCGEPSENTDGDVFVDGAGGAVGYGGGGVGVVGGAVGYGGVPVGYGGVPVGYGGVPVGYGGTPIGNGGTPIGNGGTPIGNGGTPIGNGGTPIGNGGTPIGNGGTPIGNGGTPIGNGGTPIGNGGTPIGNGGTPIGNGGTPIGNGGTPIGSGGEPVGTGGSVQTTCTFNVSSETSTEIPTVGIVTWSVDGSVNSASIDFGLDTSYGMTAPVDLAEPNYRTLLLGMKPSQTYHFRVTATTSSGNCSSEDFTIQTGARSNTLKQVTVSTPNPSAASGGFLVTSEWQAGPAFIVDADGEYVWWYNPSDHVTMADPSVTRARMSYDGKYMWIINNNNMQSGQAQIVRVTMDGLQVESFSEIDHTHDATITSDERLFLPEFSAMMGGGCGGIYERSPNGSVRAVVDNVGPLVGGTDCHVNSIHYNADDDSITFSELTQGAYVKVSSQGQHIWTLGGPNNDFTGDGATWSGRNHGHHVLAPDRLLIFDNGQFGQSSIAYEIQLDLNNMTATRVWQYDSGNTSNVLGDVQRLPNGNTLVSYCDSGVIHEVDANGNLLKEYGWAIGGALGYVNLRETLYGPPPKP